MTGCERPDDNMFMLVESARLRSLLCPAKRGRPVKVKANELISSHASPAS